MNNLFTRIARSTANGVAHPVAFVGATLLVLAWAACGPSLHYSETWQLVVNTATSVLTFLMIFLLQNTQNRDARAMHVKLDELLRAVHGARTEMVDLENVTEEELAKYCDEFKTLHRKYAGVLAQRGQKLEILTDDEANVTDVTLSPRPRGKAARPRKNGVSSGK
jgi:low affinity Fe/Cu permease